MQDFQNKIWSYFTAVGIYNQLSERNPFVETKFWRNQTCLEQQLYNSEGGTESGNSVTSELVLSKIYGQLKTDLTSL